MSSFLSKENTIKSYKEKISIESKSTQLNKKYAIANFKKICGGYCFAKLAKYSSPAFLNPSGVMSILCVAIDHE